jgi:hypothetical protein
MSDEARLFDRRVAELEELIEDHLQRGSLDEGNAAAFDRIIDAWLEEELAEVDRSCADSLREQTATLRAARGASDARRTREETVTARREAAEAERRRIAKVTADARTGRRFEAVRLTRSRLEAATDQLDAATDLLLGAGFTRRDLPPMTGPTTVHGAVREDLRNSPDKATGAGSDEVVGEVVHDFTNLADGEYGRDGTAA